MNNAVPLSYRASLADYERQADSLFHALESHDEAAIWRFKWEHPRFRGRPAHEVKKILLAPADAQLVIARGYGFENWQHLAAFTEELKQNQTVEGFEAAAETVISGDIATLRLMLNKNPDLVRARSFRRHHATLLHYLAANGVENFRQRTPQNAVQIAQLLLDTGAEVDALADMYDQKCTTLSMLVSSSPPAHAGLQTALAETLLDYGAALDGAGSKWQSALMTSLAFGFLDTAKMLARRGAPLNYLPAVAGLGRLDEAARLLPLADGHGKHLALALAAQHGHTEVVRLLLDAGENPNRYNPDGFHSHSTPLHQAVWANHFDVVKLLVERGARLDLPDTIYDATPLDWAIHGERSGIANFLRTPPS